MKPPLAPKEGTGAPKIKITSRMLEAGLRELDGGRGSYDDIFLLKAVYTAMREAETQDSASGKASR